MLKRQAVTVKMNDGMTYRRGGARLGEKYKSKYEADEVSCNETPQTWKTQATAITRFVSVQFNCPVANADMTQ
jgi:hypothetical protein